MIERVIVAGGGTGGHLFPGVAVIEELRRRNPELEVLFVGTERGIEARVVPEMGEQLALLEVTPLKGRSAGELLSSLTRLPGAAARAMGIVRRFGPSLVIGVGGYASGPVLAAAAAMGVPTAILEQNAHVGLTNRMLSKVVGRAFLTFEETRGAFSSGKARVVGNPVRRAFVDAARRAAVDPQGFEARARRVLVLGGSQGAKALNQNVPDALAAAGLAARGVTVLHQTGAAMKAEVEARYRDLGIDADVVSFIDDMAAAYASASVVVSRAGATTVAEICAVGRPSVLVPYPFAADDHQGKNAEALARAGAAVAIREEALTPERLGGEVASLLDDEGRRRAMAEAARAFGKPDAAAAIVDDLCAWLGCVAETFSADEGGAIEDDGDSGSSGSGSSGSGGTGSGGSGVRRSSAPGRTPYEPRASLLASRRSSVPPEGRPALVVGWGDGD